MSADQSLHRANRAFAGERALIGELVGDQPGPLGPGRGTARRAAAQARRQGDAVRGGPGRLRRARRWSSRHNGELTAYVGSLCSSLRSIMTSQGMAAWTIQRLGDREQRRRYLADLTSGQLAAVAFSEPERGQRPVGHADPRSGPTATRSSWTARRCG